MLNASGQGANGGGALGMLAKKLTASSAEPTPSQYGSFLALDVAGTASSSSSVKLHTSFQVGTSNDDKIEGSHGGAKVYTEDEFQEDPSAIHGMTTRNG